MEDVAAAELEQWRTYAGELEARVAEADESVTAWAEAHQELSERVQQSEAALAVRLSSRHTKLLRTLSVHC